MDEPILNTLIGNYIIESRIKAGGVAVVYRAADVKSGEPVALKLLQNSWIEHDEVIQRFEREAVIMAELEHPNIVRFIATGHYQRRPYIVMEFLPGGSLSERLQKLSQISLGASASLIEQVASALDYAHSQGIIHRDLKPGNILMRDAEHAAITDFGIARVLERTQLTMLGYMPGTPHYMSPEQAHGAGEIGIPSDVYSLGIIAYLLATGKLPFTGSDPLVIINQHLMAQPVKPSHVNPALPGAVDSVLNKALSKNPEKRFSSTGELSQAFSKAITNHSSIQVNISIGSAEVSDGSPISGGKVFRTQARPSSKTPFPTLPHQRRGQRRLLLVAGLIVMLILSALFVLTTGNNGGQDSVSASNATRTAIAPTAAEQTEIAILQTELALLATDTATPTPSPTATDTSSPTATFTFTPTLTVTFTSSPTSTSTPTLTLTATPTPSQTRTPTRTATAVVTPYPTYAPASPEELLSDFLKQDSPSAFNCVTFNQSFEFMIKQLESGNIAYEVVRSLSSEDTATFRIHEDFCRFQPNQQAVDIGNTLFSDMRDEIQTILASL